VKAGECSLKIGLWALDSQLNDSGEDPAAASRLCLFALQVKGRLRRIWFKIGRLNSSKSENGRPPGCISKTLTPR